MRLKKALKNEESINDIRKPRKNKAKNKNRNKQIKVKNLFFYLLCRRTRKSSSAFD